MLTRPLQFTVFLTFALIACAAEFAAAGDDRGQPLLHAQRYVSAAPSERKRTPPAREVCNDSTPEPARNVLPYSAAPPERAATAESPCE